MKILMSVLFWYETYKSNSGYMSYSDLSARKFTESTLLSNSIPIQPYNNDEYHHLKRRKQMIVQCLAFKSLNQNLNVYWQTIPFSSCWFPMELWNEMVKEIFSLKVGRCFSEYMAFLFLYLRSIISYDFNHWRLNMSYLLYVHFSASMIL